jgi:hypothetical protein
VLLQLYKALWKIIESVNMDLIKTIEELHHRKEMLERVIASLEGLQASVTLPQKKRRGRKSVSLEERREISARLKRYWENRRKQRRASS